MSTKAWILTIAMTVLAAGVTGCTSEPKRGELTLNTDRLLQEDQLQGWKETSNPGPAVGDFDVVYDAQGSNTRASKNGCSVVSKGAETAIVCDKATSGTIEASQPGQFDSI